MAKEQDLRIIRSLRTISPQRFALPVYDAEGEKENVFKMLLVFDKIFDKMNDAVRRKFLESMIAEYFL